MTAARPQDVARLSIRTALAATAVIGAAYVLVAAGVVAIASTNLTAQIDARLTDAVNHVPHEPFGGGGHFEPPPSGPLGGVPLLTWTIKSDGTVINSTYNPIGDLPAQYRSVSSPTTATIAGTELRLAGAQAGDDYVVVGQSLSSVSQARSTIVLAEAIIGPLLLLAVFLGAVAIGRRVAAPIELARRRQLDFTADASHELRTPLSVIEANTSLALAQDRSAEWYRTAFERVDRESRRMRVLLDDLLWLARFDAAQAPPNVEPVDLAVMARQAAERFAAVAEARRLELTVEAPPEDAVVSAPPDWLDRLLGVLLDNACKYSPDSGTVRVSVTPEGARVILAVDDSGPGIPEGERDRIFDRFHRATDSKSGAGLGLAIADAIVRATGGQWRIGSSPAGGARLAVSWPRALAGRREPGRERRPDHRPATSTAAPAPED